MKEKENWQPGKRDELGNQNLTKAEASLQSFTDKVYSREGERGDGEHAEAAEGDIYGQDLTNDGIELQSTFIDRVDIERISTNEIPLATSSSA